MPRDYNQKPDSVSSPRRPAKPKPKAKLKPKQSHNHASQPPKPTASTAPLATSSQPLTLALETQQHILDTYTAALLPPRSPHEFTLAPPSTPTPNIQQQLSSSSSGNENENENEDDNENSVKTPISTIQTVKQALYARDFAAAFDTEEKRRAYALRWSVTRAAGYAAVFGELEVLRQGEAGEGEGVRIQGREEGEASKGGEAKTREKGIKVLALGGGGGAEIVGLAFAAASSTGVSDAERDINIHVIDSADWTHVTESLVSTLTTKTSSDDNNNNNNKSRVHATFTQQNILTLTHPEIANLVQNINLVTLCFTLNELYASSMSQTTVLLLALTEGMARGSLLLVVDSAGNYSSVNLGAGEKRYPMLWLLEHTMLGIVGAGVWEVVVKEEGRWWRWDRGRDGGMGVRYEIGGEEGRGGVELENMRCLVCGFRRL